MASPELEKLIARLRSRPDPGWQTVEELRAGFDLLMSAIPLPGDITREPITVGGRPAERLRAPGAEPGRVVLYLHGGGYVIGSIASHRELAARIGREAGAEVVIVDYRLAPEHPFPAAVEDAVAAYRWLLEQGADPARMAIAGDSAGGGLTVATLVALRDAGVSLPGAAVCLSPWVDLAGESESLDTNAGRDPSMQREVLVRMAGRYLGGAEERSPLASPVYADLTGLPPLLVQMGTAEVLHDDAVRLAERARAAGVEVTLEAWEEMIHVWHFYSKVPEARRAVERVGEFLRERTGGPAAARS